MPSPARGCRCQSCRADQGEEMVGVEVLCPFFGSGGKKALGAGLFAVRLSDRHFLT